MKGGISLWHILSVTIASCVVLVQINCPCDAISEGDGKYEINADACVDCGSCAEVCPVGAPQEG